jgi:O-antigen ligase
MVDAALLSLVVIRNWAVKGPLFLLLVVGTLFTESRGAVLGFILGGIVLLAQMSIGNRRGAVTALLPVAALVVVAYVVMPASAQDRVASIFSTTHAPNAIVNNSVSGSLSEAQYTSEIRVIYRRDGVKLVEHHPIFGVGVGNYLTGNVSDYTLTNDPHNVLLLDAGEGGLPDLVFFLSMVAGTTVLVARRIRVSPWAGPALAVQAAIVMHGLFDVYWVRGTPMVGWLLVGMALNPRLDNPTAEVAPTGLFAKVPKPVTVEASLAPV